MINYKFFILLFKLSYTNKPYLLFDYRLRNTELPVNVSNKFNCMLGKKSRMLRVEVNPQTSTASFRKDDNNGIVYIIPPNVAVHSFIKA